MNGPPQPYYPYPEDEISLKDIILKAQEIWLVIWNRKLLIIFSALILACLLGALSMRKPISFTSAMTFMVGEAEDDKGSLMVSPFDQVQFEGLKNHKLTEIARSSKIVNQILIDSDSFAHRLIEAYRLKDKWSQYDWANLDLSSIESIASSEDNKAVLNKLHEMVVGNKLNKAAGPALLSFTYNDKTELFNAAIKANNPNLSQALLDKFYAVLSAFYIDKTVGKPLRIFGQLKIQEDSLQRKLYDAESALAYASDRTRGVSSSVAKVNQTRLNRNLINISEEYEEIRSNRLKIEYLLQTETPDFQIIDQTFVPIIEKSSLFEAVLKGGLIGGLLSTIFIVMSYSIKKALSEP